MDEVIRGVVDNYRDRIMRISLFDPLYKLEKKKTKDNNGEIIDFFSLGLLTLLFFFEKMVMRDKNIGVKELSDFLYKINKDEIEMDYKGFENVARTIIEVFRPPSGKRNYRRFYNWETRKEEIVQYSILKASKSDTKTNTQYYELDEQGLELVFATKEYFSEFQLSINQLLLRKQLEKGEFAGALRQIDEMRIDVKTLEDRIRNIKHEIQRNILSEKTYRRYKDLVEDINRRLKRENEEFDELQTFVKETREKLAYELSDKRDIKTYDYIIKIQNELGQVHAYHRKLLQKSVELKTTTLQSAQESLYYVGLDSFNFKSEITSRLFSSPLPLVSSRRLINPFLSIENLQTWSPVTVFARQRVENKDKEEKSYEFLNMKTEDEINKEIEIIQKNFKFIMQIILNLLGEEKSIKLDKIVKYIKESENEEILDDLLFYHFFIILHQRSPIKVQSDDNEKELLLKGMLELLHNKYTKVRVIEVSKFVKVNDRYSIKNMEIILEEKDDIL